MKVKRERLEFDFKSINMGIDTCSKLWTVLKVLHQYAGVSKICCIDYRLQNVFDSMKSLI